MMKVLMMGLMVLLGVALAFGGGRVLYRASQSQHWPTAEATVTSSSVETVGSRRGGVRFHPEVRYQYTVGGKPYTANTLSFGGGDASSMTDAQRVTHRYATGAHVPVHYEPEDPSVACIECGGAGMSSYVVTLGGVGVAGIAGMGLLEMLRDDLRERRRRNRAQAA